MTQRHPLKLAALVLLPLLVLGGIVVKNERDIASAKTWRVKITGMTLAICSMGII